ncbi:hypothetical protein QZH41_011736 [Actinostola sp. cb2023]|nr:hypothetical protein QZH41_011736 [Actinostola sp. cb2023]
MGKSVGYCEACYEEKQKDEGKMKVGEEEKDDDDEEEETEKMHKKRCPAATKKKAGRKTQWSAEAECDLVDVIINSEDFKRKLIFINMKNQKNTEIYKSV